MWPVPIDIVKVTHNKAATINKGSYLINSTKNRVGHKTCQNMFTKAK